MESTSLARSLGATIHKRLLTCLFSDFVPRKGLTRWLRQLALRKHLIRSRLSHKGLLEAAQFHMLQLYLMDRPDAGDIKILLVTAYAKNEASERSRDAIKAMREIVKDL